LVPLIRWVLFIDHKWFDESVAIVSPPRYALYPCGFVHTVGSIHKRLLWKRWVQGKTEKSDLDDVRNSIAHIQQRIYDTGVWVHTAQ
jgi:hypothetical protein